VSTDFPSTFKCYPIRLYNRNDRRMAYDYNRCLSRGHRGNTTAILTEPTRPSSFFIDYHSHSEQLVDALKVLGDKLQFTSCKYEGGLLDIKEQTETMNKGFMRYMKKHLEKETKYQSILTSFSEIETSHRELCNKIQDIMISDTPISAMPSFQKIILDKIESACPTLKRSKDTSLSQANIYLPVFVFRVIFDTLYTKESTITLNVVFSRNTWEIRYQNSSVLGQGSEADMNKFKEVVEELVQDNDIKKRVEDYREFHTQLMNDKRINELKNKIDELWTYIHGGGYLGGIDACELCNPSL
jgi:hypothetical protein